MTGTPESKVGTLKCMTGTPESKVGTLKYSMAYVSQNTNTITLFSRWISFWTHLMHRFGLQRTKSRHLLGHVWHCVPCRVLLCSHSAVPARPALRLPCINTSPPHRTLPKTDSLVTSHLTSTWFPHHHPTSTLLPHLIMSSSYLTSPQQDLLIAPDLTNLNSSSHLTQADCLTSPHFNNFISSSHLFNLSQPHQRGLLISSHRNLKGSSHLISTPHLTWPQSGLLKSHHLTSVWPSCLT